MGNKCDCFDYEESVLPDIPITANTTNISNPNV